jgi:hypothetical protein
MALPELVKRLVEEKLNAYCRRKVPAHVLDQVRLNFKIRGNSVTLFEERPAFGKASTWVDIKVAQFRFNSEEGTWSLFCADRNSKWHGYLGILPSKNFDNLLQEVDKDPTGIFWG